jgi:membrane protease YdiL (CAAX protease family)
MGLCSFLTQKITTCVANIGLGAAATGIFLPVKNVAVSFAQYLGWVPTLTVETSIRGYVAKQQVMGCTKMDADVLVQAPCYLEELAKQLTECGISLTAAAIKAHTLASTVIIYPILEEVFFRQLIQTIILPPYTKRIMRFIRPAGSFQLNNIIDKVVRILITAALFSSFHLQNKKIWDDSTVDVQVLSAFVFGIGLGIVKESRAGILGSIVAHMVNNLIAVGGVLLGC